MTNDHADPGDAASAATPEPREVPHFSPSERVARGRAARVDLPRSVHAGWEPAPLRRNPVELLEEQARTRLDEAQTLARSAMDSADAYRMIV